MFYIKRKENLPTSSISEFIEDDHTFFMHEFKQPIVSGSGYEYKPRM